MTGRKNASPGLSQVGDSSPVEEVGAWRAVTNDCGAERIWQVMTSRSSNCPSVSQTDASIKERGWMITMKTSQQASLRERTMNDEQKQGVEQCAKE